MVQNPKRVDSYEGRQASHNAYISAGRLSADPFESPRADPPFVL